MKAAVQTNAKPRPAHRTPKPSPANHHTNPSLMSEFSQSYHPRPEHAEPATELLRRAGRKGYVFKPTNGWVTFLADDGCFKPEKQIVTNSRHPLLHFFSAEDH